jgi:deazaflavin-dependent oxidoreductase (nitroreductase family)
MEVPSSPGEVVVPEPSRLYQKLISLTLLPHALDVDKLLFRMSNYSIINRIYSRAAGVAERPCLMLITSHWKTGLLRSVVLPFHQDDQRFVVIGSHGGRPTDPIWALNLRAHPHSWVRVDRHWRSCRAHVARAEEHQRLWKEISADGAYLHYEKLAHPRVIPLVVLEPEDPAQATRPGEDRALSGSRSTSHAEPKDG